MGTFQLYRDKQENFRWRLRAGNGRIIADCGEGYERRDACEHGIDLLRRWDGEVEIYQDKGGGHRWRLRASNGEIFADGGEAYFSRSNVQRALKSVKTNAAAASVIDDSEEAAAA
jgi:uncharacterized protein YegP (UPF0339 family)